MEHGNAPAAGQQSEREAFEAWARDFGFPLERHATAPLTNYADRNATFAWVGWQARATLPAAAACAEQGEPIAYAVFAPNGNIRVWSKTPIEWAASQGLTVTPLYSSLPPPARNGGEMSDEEIEALAGEHLSVTHLANDDYEVEGARRFARAVLSASCAPKQAEGDGK